MQLAVPPIQSWPRNQPIPFHLTATATASSPYSSTTSTSAPPPTPPTDIDLSDLVLNFQLFQKIRVVAKGSYEDYDTVRQSSAVAPEKGQDKGQENVGNDGDDGNGLVSGSAKYRGGDFSVHAPDQWATEWRRSEGGGGDANAWVSEKVVVGSFKVGMLPSFVNGGLSIKVRRAHTHASALAFPLALSLTLTLTCDTHSSSACIVRPQARTITAVHLVKANVQPGSTCHIIRTSSGRAAGV